MYTLDCQSAIAMGGFCGSPNKVSYSSPLPSELEYLSKTTSPATLIAAPFWVLSFRSCVNRLLILKTIFGYALITVNRIQDPLKNLSRNIASIQLNTFIKMRLESSMQIDDYIHSLRKSNRKLAELDHMDLASLAA